MSLGRSFMKGPRFFVKPSKQRCCEACVYGSGKHLPDCLGGTVKHGNWEQTRDGLSKYTPAKQNG